MGKKLWIVLWFFLVSSMVWAGKVYYWDFENVPEGELPRSFRAEATHPRGPLARWEVLREPSAPSGQKVLALTEIKRPSPGTFNLCWTDKVRFRDGEIEVRFKAVRGRIDQGGGIMWRVKDRNNYYVVRYNPLENNFRIYYVLRGRRVLIQSADVKLSSGWHTMRVVQKGDRYEAYLDGRLLLSGRDRHITGPGGIGLWTKADAQTNFDDLRVVLY